jgi:integrase
LLFRSGWNAVQVQRFLGHSDPGFTLRRYVHLLDDDLPTPQPLGLRNDTERGDAEISAEAMAAAGRR